MLRASASNEEGDEVAVATEAEEKTPQSDTVVSPRLSVRDYHAAHRARFGSPTRSPAASTAPSDHELEDGQVDYDSDHEFVGRSPLPAHAAPVRTPCPFPTSPSALRHAPPLPSRDDAEEREVGVITNPLDKVQEQQVAVEDAAVVYTAAARRSDRREYGFEPHPRGSHNLLASEDLSAYAAGPAAQTADEVVARDALRERYLSPLAFSVFDYRTRLFEQRSGRSVPAIRGIPIVRGPQETEAQYEALFQRWCEEVRHLPSLSTLQDSWSKDDVLIERRLRFDFAKLKARRQLPPGYRPRVDWFEAPSSVQNRLSALQSQNSALQSRVDRLQAQLDLLMQMQRPAPGYPAYPSAVPYPP
ncbi:hypothetical protein BBJ28_00025255, partial [Nothophytophthora sp. Chile5]